MHRPTGGSTARQHKSHQEDPQQSFDVFHFLVSFLRGEEVPVCLQANLHIGYTVYSILQNSLAAQKPPLAGDPGLTNQFSLSGRPPADSADERQPLPHLVTHVASFWSRSAVSLFALSFPGGAQIFSEPGHDTTAPAFIECIHSHSPFRLPLSKSFYVLLFRRFDSSLYEYILACQADAEPSRQDGSTAYRDMRRRVPLSNHIPREQPPKAIRWP